MTAKKERTILKYTKREFEKLLKDKLMSECNVTIDAASADQIYRCLAMITRQIMSDRQKQFQSKVLGEGKKQVYYLCMEFLMGRSLRTSLFNLGLNEVAESVLADADVKIDTIYEQEPDAGLGNGCPAVRSGSRATPTRPRRSALTARPSRPGRAASITSSMRTTIPLSPCPTICMSPVTAPTVFPSCVCGRLRPPALI